MGLWRRLQVAADFIMRGDRANDAPAGMMVRGEGFGGTTAWTPDNYGKLQSEGFKKNTAVFRCHSLIAMNMAKINFKVGEWTKDGMVEVKGDNMLTALLEKPNPMVNGVQYRMDWCNKYLSGNSYQEAIMVNENAAGGYAKEVWVRRPDLIQVHLNKAGIPDWWEMKVNNETITWPIDPVTWASRLRQTQYFPDPVNDWYGIGPLSVARMPFDLSNAYMQWNKALVDRGMSQPGYFHMDTVIDDEEERLRLKAEIRKKYMGFKAKEFGEAPLLEGDLKFVPTGINPKDADWLASDDATVQKIANAYGVPSSLLGLKGDRADNQTREAMTILIEDAVLYPADIFCMEWNTWLVPRLPPNHANMWLYYDKAEIPALSGKKDVLWKRASEATWLTTNEKRALTGFDPIEGGDMLLIPTSLVPLELALDPDGDGGTRKERQQFVEMLRRDGINPQAIAEYEAMVTWAENAEPETALDRGIRALDELVRRNRA